MWGRLQFCHCFSSQVTHQARPIAGALVVTDIAMTSMELPKKIVTNRGFEVHLKDRRYSKEITMEKNRSSTTMYSVSKVG